MTTSSKNLLVNGAAAEDGYRQATFEEVLEAAMAALTNRVKKGTALTSPKLTRDYLMTRLSARNHEVFNVLFLDNRHRVIECLEMFPGPIHGASVHPRQVVKGALRRNAAAVILSHSHSSGVAEPSQADELITSRRRDALALVDIRVLDHLIFAGGDVVSGRARPDLNPEEIRLLLFMLRRRSPPERQYECKRRPDSKGNHGQRVESLAGTAQSHTTLGRDRISRTRQPARPPQERAAGQQRGGSYPEHQPFVPTEPDQLRHRCHKTHERRAGTDRHEHRRQHATDQRRGAGEQRRGGDADVLAVRVAHGFFPSPARMSARLRSVRVMAFTS